MKTMLVTGAGRGIGASIAQIGARESWAVVVNYRSSKEKAKALVAEIEAGGGKAIAVQADVSQETDVVRMFEEIDGAFGPVTAVINNAAIDHGASVADSEIADLERVLATNLIGTWLCAREAVRRMSTARGGKGGVIVNISSLSAKTGGLPTDVMYAASKGAVDTFTLGLAKEVGKEGIRVVAVRPGITRTEIFETYEGGIERVEEMARQNTAIGRIAEPEEIAELAVWLASEKASYVTAALYDITAGR
ncbi:MAG: SDR family oxidoreductase [Alphaproteobacteria bacterium]|nr:SDR family oxidoreductase [Alphaproteobacteria bacterium]